MDQYYAPFSEIPPTEDRQAMSKHQLRLYGRLGFIQDDEERRGAIEDFWKTFRVARALGREVIETRRERADAELRAETDTLTGVYNLEGLHRAINSHIAEVRSGVSPKSIMGITFYDLDDLKRENDTFGHERGDVYIKTFADCLEATLGKDCIVARYGGDEFVVVRPIDPRDEDYPEQIIKDDMADVAEALKINIEYSALAGFAERIPRASVGYQLLDLTDEAANPMAAIKQADVMMYKEKQRRKEDAAQGMGRRATDKIQNSGN